jgi:hypothetical protein
MNKVVGDAPTDSDCGGDLLYRLTQFTTSESIGEFYGGNLSHHFCSVAQIMG